ncbi:hypothetical protein [Stenotrophomonas sp. RAC2]|uniref:hypothetical protein n=1 Tax=Stenotrophomonas sp. RAC2 TaxID=3064902 RepID=UPI00271FA7C4|nr:hypothetical protein [Stenotrophomonas sp. RAC2]MDV9043247.1 hypothetical protein [Stenotrophomonas sp. RAC2]
MSDVLKITRKMEERQAFESAHASCRTAARSCNTQWRPIEPSGTPSRICAPPWYRSQSGTMLQWWTEAQLGDLLRAFRPDIIEHQLAYAVTGCAMETWCSCGWPDAYTPRRICCSPTLTHTLRAASFGRGLAAGGLGGSSASFQRESGIGRHSVIDAAADVEVRCPVL